MPVCRRPTVSNHMLLGPKRLLKLVKEAGLVKNLSKRELTNPEGAGFDLRIGEIYRILKDGKAFLGVEERQTPDVKLAASYKEGEKKTFKIKPGEYYLVKTIESVRVPAGLAAHLYARSTLFRCGLAPLLTQIAPGYEGELTVGLVNLGPVPVGVELGARFIHVQFTEVDGGGNAYRGQWKGGRVATARKERQV